MKTVLTLLVGMIIGGLFVYAFKYNSKNSNIDSIREKSILLDKTLLEFAKINGANLLANEIVSISNDLKQNVNFYQNDTNFEDELLDKTFEKKIDPILDQDSQFYKYLKLDSNKAFSFNLNSHAIPDKFYMAMRKIFYNAAIDYNLSSTTENSTIDNTKKKTNLTSTTQWIWISKYDILKYAVLLYTADILRSNSSSRQIDGTRIYLGLVDSNYFSSDVLKKDKVLKNYVTHKHGAILPLFVATEHDENDPLMTSYDSELLSRYDCNCGNPPGWCSKTDRIECGANNKCKTCVRDNPGQGWQAIK